MTKITRWSPMTEMTTLHDAMNQLFAESFVRPPRWYGQNGSWVPMDVYESERSYTVKLAVPGLQSDDFDITTHENSLTVRGRTQTQNEQEGVTYHVREWQSGEFVRQVQFPSPIDVEQISASLANGVLTIELPKSEKALPKRISVTSAS